MKDEGLCRLCCSQKKLVKKSHVIPDFMYKGMFNEKHQIHHGQPFDLNKTRVTQSGIWESNLFCEECETKVLGKLDLYASKVLYGGKGLPTNEAPKFFPCIIDSVHQFKADGISYSKFKLFLMSLIFRASVSNNPFFNEVRLGPHEEKFRCHIYNNAAPPENVYRVAIASFQSVMSRQVMRIIRDPVIHRCAGKTMYSMFINGGLFFYEISADYPLEFLEKACIKENNTMLIPILNQTDHEILRMLGFPIRS